MRTELIGSTGGTSQDWDEEIPEVELSECRGDSVSERKSLASVQFDRDKQGWHEHCKAIDTTRNTRLKNSR